MHTFHYYLILSVKNTTVKQFTVFYFPGGQLKTKNGQKYVFNGAPSGVYVSKACLIIAAFITVLALLFTIVITYFVTRQGFPPKEATPR